MELMSDFATVTSSDRHSVLAAMSDVIKTRLDKQTLVIWALSNYYHQHPAVFLTLWARCFRDTADSLRARVCNGVKTGSLVKRLPLVKPCGSESRLG